MATPHLGLVPSGFDVVLGSRRYSAVALTHPNLRSTDDIQRLAMKLPGGIVRGEYVVGSSVVLRVAFDSPRNHFTSFEAPAVASAKGFTQELFLARVELPGKPQPTVAALVIAPYVRLLNRYVTAMSSALEFPRPAFLVADMDRVFEFFEVTRYKWMDATRVSVKDEREPTLDLVSLSGRNPLKSNLREELRRVGPAYAVRLEVRRTLPRTNVNADRFGNFWWYTRDWRDVVNPLAAIAELLSNVPIASGKFNPTRRLSFDDDRHDV